MQTKINTYTAFGIPGTHGNTQPYYADPATAEANLKMGDPVEVTAGKAKKMTAVAKYVGIAVDPHEHVLMTLPESTRTLVVREGDTIAVAKKGSWYIEIPEVGVTVGAKVYATATGVYTMTAGSNALIGEVLATDGAASPDTKTIALVRLG